MMMLKRRHPKGASEKQMKTGNKWFFLCAIFAVGGESEKRMKKKTQRETLFFSGG
jgi:hypothetical protein